MPDDFCDTLLMALYKNKGIELDCENFRGILLLSIAGNIFAEIFSWTDLSLIWKGTGVTLWFILKCYPERPKEICEVDSIILPRKDRTDPLQWWCICYLQWIKQGCMLAQSCSICNLLAFVTCYLGSESAIQCPSGADWMAFSLIFALEYIHSINLFWLLYPPAAQRQWSTVDTEEISDAAMLFSLSAWRLKQRSLTFPALQISGGGGERGWFWATQMVGTRAVPFARKAGTPPFALLV